MNSDQILSLLPYREPFLFVDELLEINEHGATGTYRLREDAYFYEGHFPGHPVTPGVILTEIMAQIGLVCLGIYLHADVKENDALFPMFSSSNVDFLAPVYPGDKLMVKSEKIYFRFNKLKCKVTCTNLKTEKVVSQGEFSGIIAKQPVN